MQLMNELLDYYIHFHFLVLFSTSTHFWLSIYIQYYPLITDEYIFIVHVSILRASSRHFVWFLNLEEDIHWFCGFPIQLVRFLFIISNVWKNKKLILSVRSFNNNENPTKITLIQLQQRQTIRIIHHT